MVNSIDYKEFFTVENDIQILTVSFDDVLNLELYSNKVVLLDKEYDFEYSKYIEITLKIQRYNTFECYICVRNTVLDKILFEDILELDFGNEDTELKLSILNGVIGKVNEPIVEIITDHFVVQKDTNVVLQSNSFDPNSENLSYLWDSKETTESISRKIDKTTNISLKVQNESGYITECIKTITNYWSEKISDNTHRLGAVLEDVKENYSYNWYVDNGFTNDTIILGNDWFIDVDPPCDTVFYCDITDKRTNETDKIQIEINVQKEVMHVKKCDIYQEILLFPTSKYLNVFIECYKNGKKYYIPCDIDHKNKSILNCKINDITYYVLKKL